EFQRLKSHPTVRQHLEGGNCIAYGARAISEGGFQAVPKLYFPGGVLIGDSAGFVNVPRIKVSHNAMKTAMLAAESAFAAIQAGLLCGAFAGFVNVPRVKGSLDAIKTGMLAAESAFAAIQAGRSGDELVEYAKAYESSWVYKELRTVRNAKPLLSRFGTFLGG